MRQLLHTRKALEASRCDPDIGIVAVSSVALTDKTHVEFSQADKTTIHYHSPALLLEAFANEGIMGRKRE